MDSTFLVNVCVLTTLAAIIVSRLLFRDGTVKVIKSPAVTLLPKLSAAERGALPYPPDALPGGRDVESPVCIPPFLIRNKLTDKIVWDHQSVRMGSGEGTKSLAGSWNHDSLHSSWCCCARTGRARLPCDAFRQLAQLSCLASISKQVMLDFWLT